MYRIIEDISKMTTMPQSNLERISDIEEDCICSNVMETIKNGDDVCSIDIGIGTINLLVSNDCIKYKFVPSLSLSKKVQETITTNKNPLEKRIENKINERIDWALKELL